MGRITSSTKEVIKNYYKNRISELKEKINIEEKTYKMKFQKNFENDKEVIKINEEIMKLSIKYSYDFDKIYFPNWRIETSECEEIQNLRKEIVKIESERDILITRLDIYPKSSSEYKEALKKLNEIIEGRK